MLFFFYKQKTAYELRISDLSSDVCSSDLLREDRQQYPPAGDEPDELRHADRQADEVPDAEQRERSEEHTSELQSLMRSSYAVFCLKQTMTMQQLPPYDVTHSRLRQE